MMAMELRPDLDGGPCGLYQRGLSQLPPGPKGRLPALSSLGGNIQADDSRCAGVAKLSSLEAC